MTKKSKIPLLFTVLHYFKKTEITLKNKVWFGICYGATLSAMWMNRAHASVMSHQFSCIVMDFF